MFSEIKIRSVLKVNALGLGDAWYLCLLRLSNTSCISLAVVGDLKKT